MELILVIKFKELVQDGVEEEVNWPDVRYKTHAHVIYDIYTILRIIHI